MRPEKQHELAFLVKEKDKDNWIIRQTGFPRVLTCYSRDKSIKIINVYMPNESIEET